MTTRLGAIVPRELQDEIIGHLWKDSRSLAVCSLVSSPWFQRARTLLFSNFTVEISTRNEQDSTRTTRLMELLVAPHSRLGRYIQYVFIYGPDTLYEYMRIDWRAPVEAYDEFCPVLQAILPHLTRVRRLRVAMVTWARIPEHVRNLFVSLSRVVSVNWIQVHFNSLDELILFSNERFPALETLEVHCLQVEDAPQLQRSMFSQDKNMLGCLRALTLFVEESTGPLLPALMSNVALLRNINTLDLEVYDKSFLDHVGFLIRAAGSTLSVLKFNIYSPLQEVSEGLGQRPLPISLSQNINLKGLHFDELYEGDTWWLTKVLESSSQIRSLEEIHFGFIGRVDVQTLERLLLMQSAPDLSVVFKCFGQDVHPFSEELLHGMPELSKRARLSATCFQGRNWLTGETL